MKEQCGYSSRIHRGHACHHRSRATPIPHLTTVSHSLTGKYAIRRLVVAVRSHGDGARIERAAAYVVSMTAYTLFLATQAVNE